MEWLDVLLGRPLAIAIIIVVALVVRWLVHRTINKLVHRVATSGTPVDAGEGPAPSARRAQRATTMGSLFRSITTAVVLSIAAVMVLATIGIDVAPILASAGIAGIALGFGAQNLVKDFVSGVFMLLEDQYGVGDVIDTGFGVGVVESVGLRVTRVRDVNGTVWYVRNGEVIRIGNQSQGWARAVVDVPVRSGDDLAVVHRVLAETAQALRSDPDLGRLVLEEPEVWGLEQLALDSVTVRVTVKTLPGEQWRVARELRSRSSAALRAAGVGAPPGAKPA